jgi:hypothetical protein
VRLAPPYPYRWPARDGTVHIKPTGERAVMGTYASAPPPTKRRHLCSLGKMLPGSLSRVRCRRDALAMTDWCAILPGAP